MFFWKYQTYSCAAQKSIVIDTRDVHHQDECLIQHLGNYSEARIMAGGVQNQHE